MDSVALQKLSAQYGDSFYILDSKQFKENYLELLSAFQYIYPNTNIAYSYKTNYIPKLCKIVNELNGHAEVVSEMELQLALNVGVHPEKIIWNGPYKKFDQVEKLLLSGGVVNLDSTYEIPLVLKIAQEHPNKRLNIGIRCNFDIGDGVLSRFGFDVESAEFADALKTVKQYKNIHLTGLHCHFAARRLETWMPRVKAMLDLITRFNIVLDFIDLGGGIFGKMEESLKVQFDSEIPDYKEYALTIATQIALKFKNDRKQPLLLIEPGSAVVGDCMSFVTKVVSIKTVRGKNIATVSGSVYNINPTLNNKNPPISIYNMSEQSKAFTNLDFGGYTCIESDYLYRGYSGELAVGDFVVFDNVGSYSVVLKPPFILPNFAIIDIGSEKTEVIKSSEHFDDIFHTYKLD